MTTTTTEAVAEEGGEEDNMGATDGNNGNEAENTKGGGGDPAVKYGKNDEDGDDKEDLMEVLPPLVSCIVERLECLNTDRERLMGRYLEERVALEMKYSDLCKPLYEERGNVIA